MHDRALPRENEKALIFILANRVMAHANLGPKKKKEVLELAATVVMYDHGYKQVQGVDRLSRTWAKRLEASFQFGANTQLLNARHKGSVGYTDQLEAEHPGYIHELYRYAEQTLGNQARYEDLAKCTNARSRIPGEE